jgi:hypothetical protein
VKDPQDNAIRESQQTFSRHALLARSFLDWNQNTCHVVHSELFHFTGTGNIGDDHEDYGIYSYNARNSRYVYQIMDQRGSQTQCNGECFLVAHKE